MKKIKRFFKVCLISFAFIIAICAVSGAGYYYYVTNSISLDENKLDTLKATSLEIFDINNINIKPSSENYTDIKTLSNKTKNAFISAEDKRFYSHYGVDFIRIGGALISNIKTKSFSQGASTISQQLIKNTQLSSEKTIPRKLKEIKLTRELEKKYSKDDILELYLNNIYFGNGCYGIENASLHYFSKSAKDLNLAESAILAGTINAPSIYDIESNPEKANSRKNLILELMYQYGHISKQECLDAKNENVNLNISKLSNNNFIYNEIIEEASKELRINENSLKASNLKIYTYIDSKLQNQINNQIKENYSNLESSPKVASIVIDNETNGIMAVCGDKNTITTKKQPGSTIKPILVYAPAIEKNIISPATKILDEKINISGYSPENADKKYHGLVSARMALKNSYNIPAVKLLKEVGISDAQEFAKKLGIQFSEKDNNLAIALGGFTDGVTLFDLCDAYETFANSGEYAKSKYINKIIKNNQVVYKNEAKKNPVMLDSTAYLITDMLKESSVSGTAKRLKGFNFDIASKTGTVGLSGSKNNINAYNISYTNNHTILSFFGETKMPESINGSTYPTLLTKDVLNFLYDDKKPQNFITPKSVTKKAISKASYETGIVTLASKDEEGIIEIFTKTNEPIMQDFVDFKISITNTINKSPMINFNISDSYDFKIIRQDYKNDETIIFDSQKDCLENKLIYKKSLNNEINELIFIDKTAKHDEIYEYYVEFLDKTTKNTTKSQSFKLKTY